MGWVGNQRKYSGATDDPRFIKPSEMLTPAIGSVQVRRAMEAPEQSPP